MTSLELENEGAYGILQHRIPNSRRDCVHSHGTAPSDDLQELLTVDEVAALLKVSKSWVYEHTRSRGMPRSERLPHVKIGKYVRFDAAARSRVPRQDARRTT